MINNEIIKIGKNHAGVDEAGRGCLVGSVFAAAVILPEEYDLPDLTDSKKLSETKRNNLEKLIKEQAISWCVASASPQEILELNILHASLLAMKRAILGLSHNQDIKNINYPEKVWIDGNKIPPDLDKLGIQAQAVVKGDSKIAAISAASILAKTARDAQMYELAKLFPQYGFDKHKGYGTKAHLAALEKYGALPEHRADFAPVKAILSQQKLLYFND